MSFNLPDLTNSNAFRAVWGSVDNNELSTAKREYRMAGNAIDYSLAMFERECAGLGVIADKDLLAIRESMAEALHAHLSNAREVMDKNGVTIPDLYKAGA